MRTIFSCLCVAALLMFTSCQKEISLETGATPSNPNSGGTTGGGNTNGDIITLVTTIDGADSSAIEYGYDNSNRILFKREYYKESGQIGTGYGKYYRDGEGRINKIAAIDNTTTDTSYATFHYPAAGSNNFDYKIAKFKSNGQTVTDSAVFTYSNNLPVKEEHYLSAPSQPIAVLFMRAEYTHSTAGNVESIKTYTLQQLGGNLVYGGEFKFTYDNKSNPTYFGKDALAVESYIMKNNAIKQEIIDPNPSNNITVDIAYQYNQKGFPTSATAPGANGTATVKFYYK